MKTYRISPAFCAEPTIFGRGRWYLAGLEEHLPDVFMPRDKELQQRLVLGRVELPQVESPLLTWEDPTDEHNLDYVDKFEIPVHQGLDTCLESGQLSFITPR